MPRGNGTGPMGMGPMTGRGAGYCNGFAAPGYANPTGLRCGFGRGQRNILCAAAVPGWARYGYTGYTRTNAFDEKTFLKSQAEFHENQLQQVKKRLSDLSEEAE